MRGSTELQDSDGKISWEEVVPVQEIATVYKPKNQDDAEVAPLGDLIKDLKFQLDGFGENFDWKYFNGILNRAMVAANK